MKRSATQMAPKAAKKAKQQDPVEAALAQVVQALNQAEGLTSSAAEMLSAALPGFLGVAQDARHKYQQGLVDIVREELSSIESNMQRIIAEAQEEARGTEAARASKSAELAEAKTQVQTQQEVLQQSKVELANIAMAFRAARQALEDAECEQTSQTKEINRAGAKKTSLEQLLEALETVHERPEEVESTVEGVMRHLKVDDSMRTAMPSALSKAPDARGQFDVMVFDALRASGAAQLKSLEETLQAAEPLKASLAQGVQSAADALDAAKQSQVAAADSFLQEQAKLNTMQQELASAQSTLSKANKSARQAVQDQDRTEAELDLFRQDALASFTFLSERVTPAPEPEPQAATETETAQETEATMETEAAPETEAAAETKMAMEPEATVADKIQGAAQAMELGPQELGCAGA